MLFDDVMMINGLYAPNDKSPHGNDFGEPAVIANKSSATGRLIGKHVAWFDRLFEYLNSATDSRMKDQVARGRAKS
jgi:hypothetical protein